MSRADDALLRLYESADLRDELTDAEAETLLKWAEGEVSRLDQPGADDDLFAAQVDTLMKLLKSVNRFAGRQGQMSAQADDPLPGAIAGQAGELGHATRPEQIAAAATGDPFGTVQALIGLLGSHPDGQPAAPPTITQPTIEPPAVEPPAIEPPTAEPLPVEPPAFSDDEFFFGDIDL